MTRIRDLGIIPGVLPMGTYNAITDVPGVRVGHRLLSMNGTKNHAKENGLMMWLRGYDKNGWQNAHGHFASQKGD